MIISGLQKLTLLDFPSKVACTVFTHGCNFRCPFCHNAPLVTQRADYTMSEEEFFSFLSKRRGILDAVCITGGEPTLQKDLEGFIRKIRDLGFLVKLDTNGSNPDVLSHLLDEGLLDYVAMDIKNREEKYNLTCGCEVDIEKIRRSVDILKESSVPHEFRTTTLKEFHTREDFIKIINWLGSESAYFIQQFTETDNVISHGLSAYSDEELKELGESLREIKADISLRGV